MPHIHPSRSNTADGTIGAGAAATTSRRRADFRSQCRRRRRCEHTDEHAGFGPRCARPHAGQGCSAGSWHDSHNLFEFRPCTIGAGGKVFARAVDPDLVRFEPAVVSAPTFIKPADLGATWDDAVAQAGACVDLVLDSAKAQLGRQVADAERLPYRDDSFDVVTSCVGVMFAPHHAQAADELVRVCRPDGRIGLINWTPAGFIGELFTTMKPFAPAPPPGASAPPLWGSPSHVRELFGADVDVSGTTERLRVDRFATGEEFRDFFKTTYGPTIAAYRNIADDHERVAHLDWAIAELAERYLASGVMEWEYLLVVATLRR